MQYETGRRYQPDVDTFGSRKIIQTITFMVDLLREIMILLKRISKICR